MSTTDDNNDQRGDSSIVSISKKEECTSCEQNNIDNITKVEKVTILSDMSTCASCGKEGNSGDMNTCNKCKMVKYCFAACKKKHRKKHKKACEKRVAELHDEQLFKEPPSREECPICMSPLPYGGNTATFMTCCGKVICHGCIFTMKKSGGGKDLCPFCRIPDVFYQEHVERVNKLMEKGNANAFNHLAGFYAQGINGMPQDYQKANELFLKAGELGYAEAYFNLGLSYQNGDAVEVDMKKAKHYFELAAMGGNVKARTNLGFTEGQAGNHHRAYKHLLIGARAGDDLSLENVKRGYKYGLVTKDEYADTLRVYLERQKEMKSDERDKAAAARNQL